MHGGAVATNSAITAERYNAKYVATISAVAALGGLLFGYDFVVIGGAKPFYEAWFRLASATEVGWANSCALLGCLVGWIALGLGATRFGREHLYMLFSCVFLDLIIL